MSLFLLCRRENRVNHTAFLHGLFLDGKFAADHRDVVFNDFDRDFGMRLLASLESYRRFDLVAVRKEFCGLLSKSRSVADVDCRRKADFFASLSFFCISKRYLP